jgi:hypothetical protein
MAKKNAGDTKDLVGKGSSGPYDPLERNSTKTKQNHGQGETLYDVFAVEQNVKKVADITWNDVTEHDGEYIKKVFDCYASFLLQYKTPVNGGGGKHLKPGTQTQYLSNAKNAIASKHKKATVLQKNHQDSKWFSQLYDDLYVRACAYAMKRGEPVKTATLGLRRKILTRVAKALVGIGNATSFEERAVLITLYMAVGRGGEVSLTHFDGMRWSDEDEALWTAWPEIKTGHFGDISFHADATLDYRMDWLHSIACYIITAAGKLGSANKNPDDPAWLFPGYTNLADGGASSKASRILKKLAETGTVEGLRKEHTSHSLRAGSSDDMATNIWCHIVSMICRGNWDWTGECQIFGYVTKIVHVLDAGRALAGQKDCRQHLSAPSLDAFITPENRALVERFAYELFMFGPDALQPKGHLVQFRNAMLASLLMFFEEMERDYGHANLVVEMLVKTSEKCGISLGTLRKWGAAVRSKFLKDLTQNQRTSGTELEQAHALIGILEDQVKQQGELNSELVERIWALEGAISTLQNGMDTLVQHIVAGSHSNSSSSSSSSSSQSPARKRRKDSSSPLENGGLTPNVTPSPNVSVPGASAQNVTSITCALMGKPKPPPFKSNTDMLNTPVGTFLVRIHAEKIDVRNGSIASLGIAKQGKTRAKAVYDNAVSLATEQEKQTLLKVCPDNKDPNYQAYFKELNTVASSIVSKQFEAMKAKHVRLFPDKDCNLKDLTAGFTVSTAANMIEKFRKVEARSKQS